MERSDILPQRTYQFPSGALCYVHDISGQKVIYCRVGETERHEASIGRFASLARREVPNQ